MKFYKAYVEGRYIVANDPITADNFHEREIHPRDLPSTGILGAAYDAGFSDGVEMGADGWQAVREQLVEERDILTKKLERVNIDAHDKGMTIFALRDKVDALSKERDNAVRASQHIAEELEKAKQAHLGAIMQRNAYSKLLVHAEERARHIAGVRDSLAKELSTVNKQLATVSADRAELEQRIVGLSGERNRLQETVEELREKVAELESSLQKEIECGAQLAKTCDASVSQEHHSAVVEQLQKQLSQQELYFRNILDAGRETEKKLNKSLNRVVADRDRFQKLYTAELAKQSTGSTAYAEGLNNGRGYAYTEISNHCRELRSKLKGEY